MTSRRNWAVNYGKDNHCFRDCSANGAWSDNTLTLRHLTGFALIEYPVHFLKGCKTNSHPHHQLVMFLFLFTRYPVSGTSAGQHPTRCSHWNALDAVNGSGMHSHLMTISVHCTSLLVDLLGHSPRSVYVSAGVLPAAHARTHASASLCVFKCVYISLCGSASGFCFSSQTN